jgi:hypothetical protein
VVGFSNDTVTQKTKPSEKSILGCEVRLSADAATLHRHRYNLVPMASGRGGLKPTASAALTAHSIWLPRHAIEASTTQFRENNFSFVAAPHPNGRPQVLEVWGVIWRPL